MNEILKPAFNVDDRGTTATITMKGDARATLYEDGSQTNGGSAEITITVRQDYPGRSRPRASPVIRVAVAPLDSLIELYGGVPVGRRPGLEPLQNPFGPNVTYVSGMDHRGMAEREGFEPTVEFPLHTLSKRAPSTTRTSLRLSGINSLPEGGEPCKSKL